MVGDVVSDKVAPPGHFKEGQQIFVCAQVMGVCHSCRDETIGGREWEPLLRKAKCHRM